MNENTAPKYFEDQSPFRGWLEFDTPDGRLRVHRRGRNAEFFQFQGGGFVRVCELSGVPHKASPEELDRLFRNHNDACDEADDGAPDEGIGA